MKGFSVFYEAEWGRVGWGGGVWLGVRGYESGGGRDKPAQTLSQSQGEEWRNTWLSLDVCFLKLKAKHLMLAALPGHRRKSSGSGPCRNGVLKPEGHAFFQGTTGVLGRFFSDTRDWNPKRSGFKPIKGDLLVWIIEMYRGSSGKKRIWQFQVLSELVIFHFLLLHQHFFLLVWLKQVLSI